MNKSLAIALLIGGILLLAFGLNASNSVSSEISEAFTGAPTDKAVWMLVGGAIIAVAGLFGVMRGGR